jgi:hypothetical protein
MITTAKTGTRADDIAITNPESAGLPEACVVRVARLTTIAESLIARRIGEIKPKDRNAVSALLRRYAP